MPAIPLSLGTNLCGSFDYSSEQPFLNVMKLSRQWLTQVDDGPWDTGEESKIDRDPNGYPKSLPAANDTSVQYRYVRAMVLTGPTPWPKSNWICLYEGEGEIVYSMKGRKISGTPGRDVVEFNPDGGGEGIHLEIRLTKVGNHIRNIRLVPEEHEEIFKKGEFLHPTFVEKTKHYDTLRFMDLQSTNFSKQESWANRPKPDYWSWGLEQGIPVETIAAMCNKLGCNAWICMPHKATDEYMREFAKIMKAQLNPSLKCFVEYSNEVWNWKFEQAQWCLQEGKKLLGNVVAPHLQFYGMRMSQMAAIWTDIMGDRVIPVGATQTAWYGSEESWLEAYDWMAAAPAGTKKPAETIKAYAVTSYFSGKLGAGENKAKVLSWISEPDGGKNKCFEQLEDGRHLVKDDIPSTTIEAFSYHKGVADKYELQLVVYEGGSHIVGDWQTQGDDNMTQLLTSLHNDERMGTIYLQLLEGWKTVGGTLFMNFSSIGEHNLYGSWGSLQRLFEESSPRFRALKNWALAHNPERSVAPSASASTEPIKSTEPTRLIFAQVSALLNQIANLLLKI